MRELNEQEKELLLFMADFVDMKAQEGDNSPWIRELPEHKKACQLFFRRGWLTLRGEFENPRDGSTTIAYKMSQKGYDEANRLAGLESK